jgi:hypothetical protein
VKVHCGHRCCSIATNAYHCHQVEPEDCERCAAVGVDPPGESHVVSLGRLVSSVILHVVPQIHGLDESPDVGQRVASECLRVYAEGLADQDVQALDPREQGSVLAARVGLALAFPHL